MSRSAMSSRRLRVSELSDPILRSVAMVVASNPLFGAAVGRAAADLGPRWCRGAKFNTCSARPRRFAMTTTERQDVYYDPFDVGINADPYPTYKRLRDEAPIYYNERYDFWALSRHVDVESAFKNWETFSSARGDILELIQSGVELPSGVVMFEDPPV